MAEWEAIRRGEVRVPDEQPTPARITAYTELSGRPPTEWAQQFNAPREVTLAGELIRPRLDGDMVTLEVFKPEELRRVVEYVDAALAWANTDYQTRVLPEIKRREEARQRALETRQAQLAEARRIARELSATPPPARSPKAAKG